MIEKRGDMIGFTRFCAIANKVKLADRALSPALAHFQKQTRAPHAFQVVLESEFVDADPFERTDPCVVPAATLLSQLP